MVGFGFLSALILDEKAAAHSPGLEFSLLMGQKKKNGIFEGFCRDPLKLCQFAMNVRDYTFFLVKRKKWKFLITTAV